MEDSLGVQVGHPSGDVRTQRYSGQPRYLCCPVLQDHIQGSSADVLHNNNTTIINSEIIVLVCLFEIHATYYRPQYKFKEVRGLCEFLRDSDPPWKKSGTPVLHDKIISISFSFYVVIHLFSLLFLKTRVL